MVEATLVGRHGAKDPKAQTAWPACDRFLFSDEADVQDHLENVRVVPVHDLPRYMRSNDA